MYQLGQHVFSKRCQGALLLIETRDGQRASPLTIGLAGLIENVQEASREQVAYLVDMAKADALGLLGETKKAAEMVERYV